MKDIKNMLKKKTYLVVIVIVVFLLGIYYLQQAGNEESNLLTGTKLIEIDGDVNDVMDVVEMGLTSPTNYSITIDDQIAGNSVFVNSINISEQLWVVVYEEKDGVRGNILGAARFRPENINGSVTLLRETAPASRYHVVLHIDDGDDVFNHTTDIPLTIKELDGEISEIMTVFSTNSESTTQ